LTTPEAAATYDAWTPPGFPPRAPGRVFGARLGMKRHVDALVREALRDAIGRGTVRSRGGVVFQLEPPRHEAFGWAAARFDDLVNLPASRLTGLLFAAAALVLPGASARDALRAMARDARRHRSPNAGWPESAMAGALGLKLNGPKSYKGILVNDAYMGEGRPDATAQDIRDALWLAGTAWGGMVAALLIAAIILQM